MHPSAHAQSDPHKAAIIMAGSGQVVTYRDLDRRSNQGAHLLRGLGLHTGDCVALLMDTSLAFFELVWAAQRAGLYYVCISTKLTAEEAAHELATLERLEAEEVERRGGVWEKRDFRPWEEDDHPLYAWANALVRRPKLLDAVESILGPDILIRNCDVFIKRPGLKRDIGWHKRDERGQQRHSSRWKRHSSRWKRDCGLW
jgi:hypothetical protein